MGAHEDTGKIERDSGRQDHVDTSASKRGGTTGAKARDAESHRQTFP